MSRVRALLLPIAGLAIFFSLWQLAVVTFEIPAYQLPAPFRIVRHVIAENGFYVKQGGRTAWHALAALALALLIAVPLGALMAQWRALDQLISPIAVLVQVTPIIAYAPAIVIWVGSGARTVVTVGAIVCVVPLLLNLVSGLREADPLVVDMLRSVHASRWEIFRTLRLRAALPSLFAGLRIAVGLSLIGVVLGEFFSLPKVGQGGLGGAIKSAQARSGARIDNDWIFNDQLWGAIFVLALLGTVATALLFGIERRAMPWHQAHRAADVGGRPGSTTRS
jgi:NitT/TauT family transport system permease protein